MNRGTIAGLVIVGVLVVGVGTAVAISAAGGRDAPVAVAPSPSPTTSAAEDDATGETADPMAADPAPTLSPGAYVAYSEEALAAAEGTRVLFFHAPWCPQCRALEDDLLADGVPDGITVLKVDYDSNQGLRQQYGVTLQTTVVSLDAAGEATASFVPYDDPTVEASLAGLGLTG